jgi:hypothetical protein
MTELAPAQLADLAATSLANPGRLAPHRWARATALLLRQALEHCVEQAWQTAGYNPERWSMRAQLVCLPRIADERTAQAATYTWWTLTHACHHHPYQLPPGHEELTDLLQRVRSLTKRLAQQGQT